ncbi:hypothetical protein MOBT1_003255 [Malassezia obtusa]|uniref:Mitochondrial carrier protein n=1 Tax=Malassezia obtusa TaxID=76774 RepID=A0AAF0E533_9BASI|nr:hypothetical protein MOBT1_003255 [Malassezia obtusa]
MHAKYTAIRAAKAAGLALAVLLLLFANTLVSVLITFPLILGYTRQCANYRPRGVALDEAPAPKLGPAVTGVVPMIVRTKRLEGWRGVYQGTSVAVAMHFVQALVGVGVVLAAVLVSSAWTLPPAAAKYVYAAYLLLAWIGPVLLALPFEVVLVRTAVHTHRLDWRAPRRSLAAVLSAAEYAQPWRLYALPGVLVTLLARALLANAFQAAPAVVLAARPAALVQLVLGAPETAVKVNAVRVALAVAWTAATVVLTVPVQVVAVRLMTQRTAPAALDAAPAARGAGAAASAVRTADAAPDAYAPRTLDPTAEPVISLRPCAEPLNEGESFYGAATVAPYRGALDCVRTMVREEGYESLGRGAHLTACLVLLANLGRLAEFAQLGA